MAIFLKMADLLAGPHRQLLNASTVLGQSKNWFQAEIDAACEFIDFLRFNVKYLHACLDHPFPLPTSSIQKDSLVCDSILLSQTSNFSLLNFSIVENHSTTLFLWSSVVTYFPILLPSLMFDSLLNLFK